MNKLKKKEITFVLVMYDHNTSSNPDECSYFQITTKASKDDIVNALYDEKELCYEEDFDDWSYEDLIDRIKVKIPMKIESVDIQSIEI